MVTAELATALPVLVLLILVGLAAVWVGQQRLRCVDAAREAARAVARGDSGGAPALASEVAGRGLTVSISSAGELSRVRVSLPVQPVSWLPGFTITESAVTATEPGSAGPGP